MKGEVDPKAIARRKFAEPDTKSVDVIGRYATDPWRLTRVLLDAISERAGPGSPVVELGFGSGWLLEEMARELPRARLYGLDMSPATAIRASELYGQDVRVLIGDMERMPVPDARFDVIVTCWTLYFMRDVDGAVEELKRCLRPGGRLVAATNGADHQVELGRLVNEALSTALGKGPDPDIAERFDLTTGGAVLRRHFASVELREWTGEMVIDAVGPMLALWENWRPQSLTAGENELAFEAFRDIVERELERNGKIRMTRHGGAFVADLERTP